MIPMRVLARWAVILTCCAAVAIAAARPALEHGPRRPASAAASADAAGTPSGLNSTPAPEKPAYIGPGLAISGSSVINVVVPSQAVAAWVLPGHVIAKSRPALHAFRLSPHLRSIPLLI